MRDDFAVLIPTHGRPEVKTVETLRKFNYTGKIYLILDNEDDKEKENEEEEDSKESSKSSNNDSV